MNPTTIEVCVTIAISEGGYTRCCIANSSYLQQAREHTKFMDDLRQDKQLWHCKTIKVKLPMPVEFEDIGVVE